MSSYYSSGGSFRKSRAREDVDPMSSMGNIGDIMLVFACGLMVALVVAWNVDLGQFQQVDMDQELNQDEVTEMNNELYGEGNSFVEMGKVYQDPTTGKYYLVEDGAAPSGGSTGTEGGENGQAGQGGQTGQTGQGGTTGQGDANGQGDENGSSSGGE